MILSSLTLTAHFLFDRLFCFESGLNMLQLGNSTSESMIQKEAVLPGSEENLVM